MAKSSRKSIDLTIAIPTYNGNDYIGSLLSAVLSQKTKLKYEVLIIDSGSTDGTVETIKSHKQVRLHEIPKSEFGHGKTRNLAASMASGKYIVYLSQDAIPANENWLNAMVEPFELSDSVVCVVGKQTARKFTDVSTKREVNSVFQSLGPDHSLMIHRGKSLLDDAEIHPRLTFFSDVNSASRLDFLKKTVPYRDVPYSEDQLFGSDVLDAGYLKVYAPHANVIHSNDYPLSKCFARRIDEYRAMYKVLGVVPEGRPLSLVKLFILETFRDYRYLLNDKDYTLTQKIKNLIDSPLRNFERLRASRAVFKNLDSVDTLDKFSLEKRNSSK